MTSDNDALDRLRTICLAFPEAVETGGVGNPSFKVRTKIFAMRHQHNDRWSVWCKAQPGMQHLLIDSDPTRFFAPPYVGQHGWIGTYLDSAPAMDWDQIADRIDESYRMTAPKRLVKVMDEAAGTVSEGEVW